jgi:LEA14-like dessication related protein
MMKKFTLKLLPCVVLAAALFCLGTCKSAPELSDFIKEPVIKFDSVSFKKISFDGVDLLARLNVENGNPITIPFPEIDWELFVADESFLTGIIQDSDDKAGLQELAANSTTTVEIPFTVPYKALYSLMSNLLDADEAPYKVSAAAKFPIPVLGDKVFKTEYEGSLPMLKVPSLSFSGIKFSSLSLTKVEFILSWAVENKNAFAISLDKLSYNFGVGNSPWAQGTAPAGLALAARKTTQIPVTVSINSLSLAGDIFGIVALRKPVNFNCGGEAELRPAFEGVEAFKIPFDFKGLTNL